MKITGLFAGIGGIELGMHRAGHETLALCELDPAARTVLEARFDGVHIHSDITTMRALPAGTEVVAAGFPCQDLSQAGLTKGIEGARSGLITTVLKLLGKARSARRAIPWLLIENVSFMLQLGGGRGLAVIVDAIEAMGYRWAYRVINSMAFGVPQRRERVYLLASLDEDPRDVLFADDAGEPDPVLPTRSLAFGFYWTEGVRGLGAAVDAIPTLKGGSTLGIPSPPAVVLPNGRGVVTPGIRDAERLQGFPSDWTLPAETSGRRSHRWKLVGNAVTVPVAEWIGKRLRAPGTYDGSWDRPIRDGQRWPRAAWSMGKGRYEASVSSWPARLERTHLHEFLEEPRLLSAKAAMGFLDRLQNKSSLRRPEWFDQELERHLSRVQSEWKRNPLFPVLLPNGRGSKLTRLDQDATHD